MLANNSHGERFTRVGYLGREGLSSGVFPSVSVRLLLSRLPPNCPRTRPKDAGLNGCQAPKLGLSETSGGGAEIGTMPQYSADHCTIARRKGGTPLS